MQIGRLHLPRKGSCAIFYGLIPFHLNSDTYESCRDAKFRVSTGLYLYQGFCETV
ncbi:hypothetical protein NIES4075_43310 [Tolypothrix sp. NIES-4075]|nr:hypothetical protein NIES4075_43310 [Tolypothrix sp. NIES-4075]